MIFFTPSRNYGDAERTLATLVRPRLDPLQFASRIQHLHRLSSVYKDYCAPPWASRNLHISPEISYQSELWLPLDQLRPHFYSLYRQALAYSPILSSTPFAQGTSWATIGAGFPAFLKHCVNPANLLEQLVDDEDLRLKFLFWSFMPERFYGNGSNRYPEQSAVIPEWISKTKFRGKRLRCLDAASGDGANTYALTSLLSEQGWVPDMYEIEGWTLEPLEAWAAAQGLFPHDQTRELVFREETQVCFEQGYDTAIRFCSVNILNAPQVEPFDVILCNGLLGGPIIHVLADMNVVVRNLAGLLEPGGILLSADHFHGGWKQKCPQRELRALFEKNGLIPFEVREGVGGLAPKTG